LAPLDVLAVMPAPSDAPGFDAERAWLELTRAAQPLVTRGALKLERLTPASENALKRRLAQRACNVLHFVGAGSARAAAQYGTLVFEDSTGRSRGLNANHVATLLKQHEPLELIVLQASQDGDDPLGLLADAIVAGGAPPAVATPRLDGDTLAAFVQEFYGGLIAGRTGDEALARARDALVRRGRAATQLKLRSRSPQWRLKASGLTGASAQSPATQETPAAAIQSDATAPEARDLVAEQEAARRAAEEQRMQEIARKRAAGEFDVFLCHNWADKPAVKTIAQQLMMSGVVPWLDEWELPPGRPWQPLLEQQIANIRSAAVFVGSAGLGPWQEQEINGFLRQFVRRSSPVIPVLLESAPATPTLPLFLEAMTWVDFRLRDPDPLERLVWGITGMRTGPLR
jgi:hypothetical protein